MIMLPIGDLLLFLGVVVIHGFYSFKKYSKYIFMLNLLLTSECVVLVFFGSVIVSFFTSFFVFVYSFYLLISNLNIKPKYSENSSLLLRIIHSSGLEIGLSFLGLIILVSVYFIDYHIDYPNRNLSNAGLIIVIFSLFLVFFDFLPISFRNKYFKELDFIAVFLFTLFIFVFIYNVLGEFERIFGEEYSFLSTESKVEFFLVSPLSVILNILGINAWGEGQVLYYPDRTTELISAVDITRGCSGVHSIIVFSSCFISYIVVYVEKTSHGFYLIGMVGLFLTYFANLFRMTIIVLVGHYYGSEDLVWTHKNIGWLIFTFWFMIFWYFFVNLIEERQYDRKI